MDENELNDFNVKGISDYCKNLREDKKFNDKCLECDKVNLEIAKNKKDIHLYQCHNGLTEGIVPLYGKSGVYLGSIFFGQLLTEKNKLLNAKSKYYEQLPKYTNERANDLSKLIKYLGEYIIENELLKYNKSEKGKKLKMYIDAHLRERITLKDLGKQIDRSSSFLTDYFKKEFGSGSNRAS